MNEGAGIVYEFGQFRLDKEIRRLLRGDEPVNVSPKLFDILLLLVESRGQLVTKEELIRRIWPDQFVEESNLTVSISVLRKALGESRGAHAYIETVSRRGYRFVGRVRELRGDARGAEGGGASSAAPRAERRRDERGAEGHLASVAVLPLANECGADFEYLSDGISENIVNSLSQLPRLKVMARSTVFRFKGQWADSAEIGRQLGVRAVLVGHLKGDAARLSVNVELVDVRDGSQIWGARYERPFPSILEVQDEVARTVAERLEVRLGHEERARLARHSAYDMEAYNLYLKGRYCWGKYDKDWIEKGIKYFERAIQIDPKCAPAYAGLADCYQRLSSLYLPPKEAWPKALAYARRAAELDDSLAEAHVALGVIQLYYARDWEASEREFRRALALNPGSALAHQRYGTFLIIHGRSDEATYETGRALELDPLSLQVSVNMGTALYLAGRCGESVELLRQTLELEPNFAPAHLSLGCAYREAGDAEAALGEFRECMRGVLGGDTALGFYGHACGVLGRVEEARAALRRLQAAAAARYVSPFILALVHVGLGETDEALRCLGALYEAHDDWLVWLNVAPEFKSLRPDPRFAELLRRVGFPPS